MITKTIDKCPKCGQLFPWKKYTTRIVAGQRREYVRCKRCGHHEVVIYRP